ncbi:hypothetical protein HRbin40_02455 [bacterium HR40]|nr:hypothetical protein HRbin40_02455 [bacterium HR40]
MPIAAPDIALTPVDTAVIIAPLANDTGAGLVLDGFTQPARGRVVANPDSTLTYTPAPGFVGVDSFTYTVRDAGGATATATVTISVLAPNAPPVARDDEAASSDGSSIDIPVLANDGDPDGDPLQLLAIGAPAHGTATFLAPDRIRYRPPAGFSGIDRFTYTVGDGRGEVATGTVTVRVGTANQPPVVDDATLEVTTDTPALFAPLACARDPDGDPLRLEALSVPAHGRLVVNADRTLTYTPRAGFVGEDSFAFTVSDSRGGLATGTVRVTVNRPNLPPVANDDALSTPQDTPLLFDPRLRASDPDGDPLRLTHFSLPRHGRLALEADGRLLYTPDAGFTGEDSFTFTLSDGRGGVATGTVRIAVTPASPPMATFANGFRRRRRILLPARQTAHETVSGFVLLVREQGDWLKDVARGGQVESPQGFDLRFEDADGTRLPHDLEHYDPATGTLVAWVRIPSWDIARNLTLFLYYGKPELAASEADPAATWQDYLAVWDPVTGRDRSGHGRDLVASGVTAAELVGPAGRFDGTGDLRLADATFLDGLDAICVSAIVQADATLVDSPRPARILQQGSPTASVGSLGLSLLYTNPGYFGQAPKTIKFSVLTTAGSAQVEGPADAQRPTPMVVAGSWRSGELPTLWIDGRAAAPSWVGLDTGTGGQPGVAATGRTRMVVGEPLSVGLGRLNTARSWVGLIDTVRLSASVPSATRLALEADNVHTPWRLYVAGEEERPEMADFPPLARTLEAATPTGLTVDIDVVAAAHDPEGLPLRLTGVGVPTHGVASIVDNRLRYAPFAGFVGEDVVPFTIRDAAGHVASGRVRVQVTPAPANELPPPLRTVEVATAAQLQAALAAARPGDLIRLANGLYAGNFELQAQATADRPIVVRAQSLLGATFSGSFTLSGSCGVLYGLAFAGPDSGVVIAGSDNRVTRCTFRDSTRNAVIQFRYDGTRGRLDHCDVTVRPFDGSEPAGTVRRAIVVDTRSDRTHTYARIDRNWIHDFGTKPNPNDYWSGFNTALVVTTTGLRSHIPTYALIEYNRFENFLDSLGASVATKGTKTTFQYNTFINSQGFLELRCGWESKVVGNWFEDWRYITVRDSDHIIANNRFVNSQGIFLMAGNREANISDDERGRALRVRVAHNQGSVVVGKKWVATETYPAKDCVIEAHTGAIQYELHTGTVVRPTSDIPPYTPVKLGRSDVGPFAP